MKFGKLEDISRVDFTLPDDPAGNEKVLNGLDRPEHPPTCYIGCTGWSMPEWIGKVYPKGAKSKDFLKYYSQQFNTIEFNTTHYRIPNFSTVEKWYEESAPDFKFCPKVPQSISHSRDLGAGNDSLEFFTDVILGLKEKLGACFLQLPPYFGHDRLALLENFLQRWPQEIDLAVEVRHESWFEGEAKRRDLFNLLFRYGAGTVITDVAGRRDVLHMALTSGVAMVRFVGNGLHPTDYERIDEWVDRINIWFEQGLHEIFFFPHEPDNILAPELALYLFEKIRNNSTIRVKGPTLLDEQEGEQMTLF
ncbi:DUF72 domain-containing protein [Flavilitoribacter nigricans]|uniref:DUF72 domain-containing protein n=1 Tax=Flavilitoribacter nigricans (strain ATCC 23147 / DSM 23189 / NBRC 102662 / NCIMB 1420 / SS-2) TaxID=1122177 RepID=A0A2D0N375_FLAN2|nr:DUF72 domain-containing protein [Flavilitoribacter nigricans]PHN02971.1 hypothetical protein CRP01_29640 [Flavilitoribacter nigricans DSM 23189 = NBRC 102662]